MTFIKKRVMQKNFFENSKYKNPDILDLLPAIPRWKIKKIKKIKKMKKK
jgi:hypothetical protein